MALTIPPNPILNWLTQSPDVVIRLRHADDPVRARQVTLSPDSTFSSLRIRWGWPVEQPIRLWFRIRSGSWQLVHPGLEHQLLRLFGSDLEVLVERPGSDGSWPRGFTEVHPRPVWDSQLSWPRLLQALLRHDAVYELAYLLLPPHERPLQAPGRLQGYPPLSSIPPIRLRSLLDDACAVNSWRCAALLILQGSPPTATWARNPLLPAWFGLLEQARERNRELRSA